MHDLLGLAILLAFAALMLVTLFTALLVRGCLRPPRRTAAWAIARGLPCDPEEAGWQFEEWWLERPGAELPVWEMHRASPEGEGKPEGLVVVVHGWGASRVDALNRLAPAFATARRVLLWDLRGHGDARGGGSRIGTVEIDDLLALLEQAQARDATLVGHSMGAVIAIAAAARAPSGTVARVVAAAPYDCFWTTVRQRLRADELPAVPFVTLARVVLALLGVRPVPAREAVRDLAVPLEVVHGDCDELCGMDAAQAIAESAPDGRLRVVPGAGHGDVLGAPA